MDFSHPGEAFRREVAAWLDRELTDDLRAEFERELTYLRVPMAWSPKILAFNRKLGAKGWIGLHWPTQYGGPGWSAVQRFVFENECALAHAPRIVQLSIGETHWHED